MTALLAYLFVGLLVWLGLMVVMAEDALYNRSLVRRARQIVLINNREVPVWLGLSILLVLMLVFWPLVLVDMAQQILRHKD